MKFQEKQWFFWKKKVIIIQEVPKNDLILNLSPLKNTIQKMQIAYNFLVFLILKRKNRLFFPFFTSTDDALRQNYWELEVLTDTNGSGVLENIKCYIWAVLKLLRGKIGEMRPFQKVACSNQESRTSFFPIKKLLTIFFSLNSKLC